MHCLKPGPPTPTFLQASSVPATCHLPGSRCHPPTSWGWKEAFDCCSEYPHFPPVLFWCHAAWHSWPSSASGRLQWCGKNTMELAHLSGCSDHKLMAKGWLEGKPRMSQQFVDCHLPCCLAHLVGFPRPSRQPWLTIQQPLPLLSADHPVLLERPAMYFSGEVCPVGVQGDKGVLSRSL